MDKIWDRNPSKSEVIGRCGGDEKTEWPRRTEKSRKLKKKKIAYAPQVKVWKIQIILSIQQCDHEQQLFPHYKHWRIHALVYCSMFYHWRFRHSFIACIVLLYAWETKGTLYIYGYDDTVCYIDLIIRTWVSKH